MAVEAFETRETVVREAQRRASTPDPA